MKSLEVVALTCDVKEKHLHRGQVRFRKNLLDEGIDLFELFKLEQAFIKSVENRDASIMKSHKVPDEVKDLVLKFTGFALTQILETYGK